MDRDDIIHTNRLEYGEAAELMRWITPEESARMEDERARHLRALDGELWGYGGSKADCRSLSPGCRHCGDGWWSCLFVNGVCNAHCFYCPTEQREPGEPTTNTLAFPRPDTYASYLRRFGFRGSSMSGGEPLLTFERTLRYLEAAREALGPQGYLWLYTNGTLATEEKLDQLAETGLDEVRFDLTATDYDLAPLNRAADRIRTVTVEIPAIPEDAERLEALLPELAAAGVKHLNLHELRCTPHNLRRASLRGYAFRHGPKVTVAGSEIAALRVLRASLEARESPAVNYCSFIYKHRYQARAARARAAAATLEAWESITEAGYVRRLAASGSAEELDAIDVRLRASGAEAAKWRLDRAAGRLELHPDLLETAGPIRRLRVSYELATLRQSVSYRRPFREVDLGGGVELVVERESVAEEREATSPGAPFERLDEGLYPYF